jgi:hypothetical protein
MRGGNNTVNQPFDMKRGTEVRIVTKFLTMEAYEGMEVSFHEFRPQNCSLKIPIAVLSGERD